ncbi:MAG: hypothetical protein ACFCUW_11980 [Kiloniellaceae bacterium]
MKHDELRSIAHNFAESLACGLGLVIGYCPTDIFGEARKASGGYLAVDFLTGQISGGQATASLAKAITRYRDALPGFCEKHGASVSDFRELTVRYVPGVLHNRFIVAIEDTRGRRSSTEYAGMPGQRVKVLDERGRLRPKAV